MTQNTDYYAIYCMDYCGYGPDSQVIGGTFIGSNYEELAQHSLDLRATGAEIIVYSPWEITASGAST